MGTPFKSATSLKLLLSTIPVSLSLIDDFMARECDHVTGIQGARSYEGYYKHESLC
jgi:hypothetical protein